MSIISEKIDGLIIHIEVKSTNIKTASYNTETKVLSVTFNNGAIYEYENVPWELFVKFRMSESQGVFFNANIKSAFKFKKVN